MDFFKGSVEELRAIREEEDGKMLPAALRCVGCWLGGSWFRLGGLVWFGFMVVIRIKHPGAKNSCQTHSETMKKQQGVTST